MDTFKTFNENFSFPDVIVLDKKSFWMELLYLYNETFLQANLFSYNNLVDGFASMPFMISPDSCLQFWVQV